MKNETEQPPIRNRRSRIFVNREMQSRIMIHVSWPSAVALALTAVLLGVFSKDLLDEAMVAKIELPSLVPLLLIIGAFLLVSVIFLAINSLKFSHRIAGPAFRIVRTMEAAHEGDYSIRANLRSTDLLNEVAESVNRLLDKLQREQMMQAASGSGFEAQDWDGPVDEAIDFATGAGGPGDEAASEAPAAGERSAGKKPAGKNSAGKKPAGKRAAGKKSAGKKTAKQPAAGTKAADTKPGKATAGKTTAGGTSESAATEETIAALSDIDDELFAGGPAATAQGPQGRRDSAGSKDASKQSGVIDTGAKRSSTRTVDPWADD